MKGIYQERDFVNDLDVILQLFEKYDILMCTVRIKQLFYVFKKSEEPSSTNKQVFLRV